MVLSVKLLEVKKKIIKPIHLKSKSLVSEQANIKNPELEELLEQIQSNSEVSRVECFELENFDGNVQTADDIEIVSCPTDTDEESKLSSGSHTDNEEVNLRSSITRNIFTSPHDEAHVPTSRYITVMKKKAELRNALKNDQNEAVFAKEAQPQKYTQVFESKSYLASLKERQLKIKELAFKLNEDAEAEAESKVQYP